MHPDTTRTLVLQPGDAAARLGIGVPQLVRLIRHYRYAYTELVPGGRPGDVGRGKWGLTEPQLEAIVRGQARAFAAPPGRAALAPTATRALKPPPGGWPSTVGR